MSASVDYGCWWGSFAQLFNDNVDVNLRVIGVDKLEA